MSLSDRLTKALEALPPAPEDAGTVALIEEYARLIDNAAPAAKYRKALDWLNSVDSEDEKANEYAALISTALAEHTVASDLGPKLLAGLDALGMTVRARQALKVVTPDDKPADPLDALAERRSRKSRTEDLDATAT